MTSVDPAFGPLAGGTAVTIADAQATEGTNGTTPVDLIVTKTGETELSVSVQFSTQDGTASSTSDYISSSGTLIIPASSSTGTIRCDVVADNQVENDETFTVNLSNATNATILDGTATVEIVNDDTASNVSQTRLSPALYGDGVAVVEIIVDGIKDASTGEVSTTIDRKGVGELVRTAVALGREARPDLGLGICGEHGGDPASIQFFFEERLDYVSCSPLSSAGGQASRRSGRDPVQIGRPRRPIRLPAHPRVGAAFRRASSGWPAVYAADRLLLPTPRDDHRVAGRPPTSLGCPSGCLVGFPL